MNGTRTSWLRGPRTPNKTLKGKNGGPVIEQEVVKVIEPRATGR